MLDKEDFEHISITDLCREADISRITFYSHYGDKYALVNEIFNDMLEIGKEKYYRRQSENNPKKHLVTGYVNILNSILDADYERMISSGIRIRRKIPILRQGCAVLYWRWWSFIQIIFSGG